MQKLLSLLGELKISNKDLFYLSHLGKKYKIPTTVEVKKNGLTTQQMKELFTASIRDYFLGKSSFDTCCWVSEDIVWEIVKKHSPLKSKKRFIDLKLGKDEEMYEDFHWVSEGAFYAFYSLAKGSVPIGFNIVAFIIDLKKKYKKYFTQDNLKKANTDQIINKNITHLNFYNCTTHHNLKHNQIEVFSLDNKIVLQLPFPVSEYQRKIELLNNDQIVNLFVTLCKAHDKQKISIDTVSSAAYCILESRKVLPKDFRAILVKASSMALLERYCAESKELYNVLFDSVNEINAFASAN